MNFAGDAVRDVLVALLVIRVLRIVQVTGDPVAAEKPFGRDLDVVLDGLPDFAVRATLNIEVWLVDNAIENAYLGFAVAFYACWDSSGADYMQ